LLGRLGGVCFHARFRAIREGRSASARPPATPRCPRSSAEQARGR
jgi:hypothetical protein